MPHNTKNTEQNGVCAVKDIINLLNLPDRKKKQNIIYADKAKNTGKEQKQQILLPPFNDPVIINVIGSFIKKTRKRIRRIPQNPECQNISSGFNNRTVKKESYITPCSARFDLPLFIQMHFRMYQMPVKKYFPILSNTGKVYPRED
jgi:hypothetical protein